jgi:signal transduction histidine kinase/HAMP domain-containing protein
MPFRAEFPQILTPLPIEPKRRLMRFWPRSIRLQMLAALLLLEGLSITLFAVLMIRQQTHDIYQRAQRRLAYDARSLALQSREALLQNQPGWIGLSVKMMGQDPSVLSAKVTDGAGKILYASKGNPAQTTLSPVERAQIPLLKGDQAQAFTHDSDSWESVGAIYTGNDLRGYAWIEYNHTSARDLLASILDDTILFGVIWLVASALLAIVISRSISRPLEVLHRGTRDLMSLPESGGNFPLPVSVHNEIGDLIEAFNRMVASLAEQRAGLNDTLSLLDSMLANAPIGLAFFDRQCRLVRVNQVFAAMTGIPLSSHLGRTLPELLALPVAQQLEDAVQRVFAEEEPIRNLELEGPPQADALAKLDQPSTWLVSAYPVRSTAHQMRWVGVIVLDASQRKRNEEALRKTEKLAATGRLAASIAHEINNPLEAITNLLFLLRSYCGLQDPALNYVVMAEHEARRISEITQQTLRFYRQSTLPGRVKTGELLDSVLSLYPARINSLKLQVERRSDPELDLFCYAGELRQVFANLVGNAIDASSARGRLILRARPSRNWKDPAQRGIRFVVADTGSGMEPAVRQRIFEAFFTTKEITGTGLGLWVSQEIVQKHHGLIHVRSRTASAGGPSGTVFQIFIPDDPNLAAPVKQLAAASA